SDGLMPSALPEHDDAFWEALARRPWRRVKWRATADAPEAVCVAFGTPIHRPGTYYLRPAYTDGEAWLSQQAYDEMIRRTRRRRASRARRGTPPDEGTSP
ncbi:MAG TPA: hypothetical protein VK002_00790, partial [Rubricoccaceae bacterium]|nr:hypothetical protein [Rubricoccaceae bacterium]